MNRPKVNKEVIMEAATSIAKEHNYSATDIADAFCMHEDGFQLAKRLESEYGWDVGVIDVENLDAMQSEVKNIIRAKGFEWVAKENIQPPFPIGTMITLGEITGLCDYEPATYLVRQYGETNENRRLLVKFEKAVLHT